ncbi:MAG: HAD family hydrolase [Rhodospirillales bacterium]|nr:HAD family hydrolase [Rhodospirillales bacterium]
MIKLPATHSNTPAPGEGYLEETGLWVRKYAHADAIPTGQPALFLDRDGVINDDVHYLSKPEDVVILPGAAELIAAANKAGVAVVIITNQSGVGRGYLNWDDFAAVQAKIHQELAQHSAVWDMVIACPFHAKAKPPYDIPSHPGRKPNTRMIEIAEQALDIDLGRSWVIGDKASDVKCGLRAGLQGALYAGTHEKSLRDEADKALALATADFPVSAINALSEALPYIPFLN